MGIGIRVEGLECDVWGSDFAGKGWGAMFIAWRFRFWVWGMGLVGCCVKVWGSGFSIQGSKFKI